MPAKEVSTDTSTSSVVIPNQFAVTKIVIFKGLAMSLTRQEKATEYQLIVNAPDYQDKETGEIKYNRHGSPIQQQRRFYAAAWKKKIPYYLLGVHLIQFVTRCQKMLRDIGGNSKRLIKKWLENRFLDNIMKLSKDWNEAKLDVEMETIIDDKISFVKSLYESQEYLAELKQQGYEFCVSQNMEYEHTRVPPQVIYYVFDIF